MIFGFVLFFQKKKKNYLSKLRDNNWINGEMGQYDNWQTAPYWDEL